MSSRVKGMAPPGESPAPRIPGRGALNLSRSAGRALFQLAALCERPSADAERLRVEGSRDVYDVTRLSLPLTDVRIRGGRVGNQLTVVLASHDRDPEVRLLSPGERDRPDPVDVAQIPRSERLHGIGPITLARGKKADLWVAVVAGENHSQLVANATAADADIGKRQRQASDIVDISRTLNSQPLGIRGGTFAKRGKLE